MKRLRIALIGSSGGGVGNVGREAQDVVQCVEQELRRCDMHLVSLLLVMTDQPFDSVAKATPPTAGTHAVMTNHCEEDMPQQQAADALHAALLWELETDAKHPSSAATVPPPLPSTNPTAVCTYRGALAQANERARQADAALARHIAAGHIDAVITLSSDPLNVNSRTIKACIQARVPVVGTGGTSVSEITLAGARVIGMSGGSVATTPLTLAASNTSALAAHFGRVYTPPVRVRLAAYHSVLDATLPIVLGISLVCVLVTTPALLQPHQEHQHQHQHQQPQQDNSGFEAAHGLDDIMPAIAHINFQQVMALIARATNSAAAALTMAPTVAAGVLTATQHRYVGVEAILACIVACACGPDNLAAGVVSAALVCALLPRVSAVLARLGCPATATAITACPITGVAAGTTAAFISAITAAVVLQWPLGATLAFARGPTAQALLFSPLAAAGIVGAAVGVFTRYAANVGWYHYFILPLILLEMQGRQQLLLRGIGDGGGGAAAASVDGVGADAFVVAITRILDALVIRSSGEQGVDSARDGYD
ncbi:hypothetical protein PTSG_11457, partial [Salpingoeca rosetta]